MTAISARTSTTVDDEFGEATMMDYLAQYGYLLRQPNGYRWLGGFLKGEALQHARRVIEAVYPATVPALVLVPHTREKRRAGQSRRAA